MLRGGLSLAMSLYTQVLCLCLPVSYSREEWVTLHGGRLVSSTQEAHRSHFPKHTERSHGSHERKDKNNALLH